ncbi:TPA: peptidoglycan-binding protein, partial [Clostridioides difficile]|nr:peptidoglycan-binding protein [Clostridioides difficile]
MAYDFYLDGVQLPIPPSKLEIKVTNKNKTVDLI